MNTPPAVAVVHAERYHDFSAGHRVAGHESKCAFLHGHNYRVHFKCQAPALDSLGRVIDFSVIKSTLCNWLEENWDHRFLAWNDDPILRTLYPSCSPGGMVDDYTRVLLDSIVFVPFNPTAENMALHLLREVGPRLLQGSGVVLVEVRIEETRKCSASATAMGYIE